MVLYQHSYTEKSVALPSYLCFCTLQIRARIDDLDSANLAEVFHTDNGKYGKHSENPQCVTHISKTQF